MLPRWKETSDGWPQKFLEPGLKSSSGMIPFRIFHSVLKISQRKTASVMLQGSQGVIDVADLKGTDVSDAQMWTVLYEISPLHLGRSFDSVLQSIYPEFSRASDGTEMPSPM